MRKVKTNSPRTCSGASNIEAPKEHPILFSTDMVEAILSGRKTQTRRIVKDTQTLSTIEVFNGENGCINLCPYGKIGDILWVRETWAEAGNMESAFYAKSEIIAFRTKQSYPLWNGKIDLTNELDAECWNWDAIKWKPSIHMPKAYCRIWLEITDVRVERLNDITKEDAIAEGIDEFEIAHTGIIQYKNYAGYTSFSNPVTSFKSLWQSINGDESWNLNPWVWVISFKRSEKGGVAL